MADPIYVDVERPSHISALYECLGKSHVVEVLKALPEHQKLPGFALALALAQRAEADAKAIAVSEHLRAVARAGLNVADAKTIGVEFHGARARLVINMLDLADMAEEE